MTKRVLITGASGFLGKALTARLAPEPGLQLLAMCRSARAGEDAAQRGLVALHADMREGPALAAAVSGIDAIIHLAGALRNASSAEMQTVNVEGSRAMAHAARAAGVPDFIHISSAAVYGDRDGREVMDENAACRPVSAYERTKLDAERVVLELLGASATRLVILRPAGVYGGLRAETQAFLRTVRDRRLWIHMTPRLVLHPTYVDDVTHAIQLALGTQNARGVYNVAGESAVAYDEWIALNGFALGVAPLQWRFFGKPTVVAASLAARGFRALRMAPPARIEHAAVRTRSRALSTARIRDELGFRPTLSVDAIARAVDIARRDGAL